MATQCTKLWEIRKVIKILNDDTIDKDMPLSDIYYTKENDFSKQNNKKIGF